MDIVEKCLRMCGMCLEEPLDFYAGTKVTLNWDYLRVSLLFLGWCAERADAAVVEFH